MHAVNAQRPVSTRLVPAALLLKASALAARQVPEVNGFYTEARFRPSPVVHLGVAVALRESQRWLVENTRLGIPAIAHEECHDVVQWLSQHAADGDLEDTAITRRLLLDELASKGPPRDRDTERLFHIEPARKWATTLQRIGLRRLVMLDAATRQGRRPGRQRRLEDVAGEAVPRRRPLVGDVEGAREAGHGEAADGHLSVSTFEPNEPLIEAMGDGTCALLIDVKTCSGVWLRNCAVNRPWYVVPAATPAPLRAPSATGRCGSRRNWRRAGARSRRPCAGTPYRASLPGA